MESPPRHFAAGQYHYTRIPLGTAVGIQHGVKQASITRGEWQLTSREMAVVALAVAVAVVEVEAEGTCSSSARWSFFGMGGSESDSSSEVDATYSWGWHVVPTTVLSQA